MFLVFNVLRIYALWGKNWRIAVVVALVGYGIPFTGMVRTMISFAESMLLTVFKPLYIGFQWIPYVFLDALPTCETETDQIADARCTVYVSPLSGFIAGLSSSDSRNPRCRLTIGAGRRGLGDRPDNDEDAANVYVSFGNTSGTTVVSTLVQKWYGSRLSFESIYLPISRFDLFHVRQPAVCGRLKTN